MRFDYADLKSYHDAFEGVDRAFVMLPAGYTDPVASLQPVVQAAAERRVKVVLQTAIGVEAFPYHQRGALELSKGLTFHTRWQTARRDIGLVTEASSQH